MSVRQKKKKEKLNGHPEKYENHHHRKRRTVLVFCFFPIVLIQVSFCNDQSTNHELWSNDCYELPPPRRTFWSKLGGPSRVARGEIEACKA